MVLRRPTYQMAFLRFWFLHQYLRHDEPTAPEFQAAKRQWANKAQPEHMSDSGKSSIFYLVKKFE